jgi:hypothetical protein
VSVSVCLCVGCLPRLLIIAGVERLDCDLTIGQMQGVSVSLSVPVCLCLCLCLCWVLLIIAGVERLTSPSARSQVFYAVKSIVM